MAGFGCIFMDNVCVTYYQVIRVERNIASPFVAEALALRWALLTAHTQEYSKICFKTDCQALLAAISSKVSPADPYGIIQDIDHLSLSFISVSFKFVARQSNSAADQLAKSDLYSATSALSFLGT
ncbi:hypothetical protein Bca101_082615 [Brassica carinata]